MIRMSRDTAAAVPQWRIVIAAVFDLNQTFARFFAVASFAAVVMWSITALRRRDFSQLLSAYGCIAPPVIGILVIVGHLRMDVHGMMAVVLALSIWFVGAGWRLVRSDQKVAASADC